MGCFESLHVRVYKCDAFIVNICLHPLNDHYMPHCNRILDSLVITNLSPFRTGIFHYSIMDAHLL